MQGLIVSTVAALCLFGVADVHAAPQDPARVGGTQGGDPAAVFVSPTQSSVHGGASPAQGGTLDWVMQQASGALNKFGMRSPSADDYRAAYGNANIRERLGRTYQGGGNDAADGNWLGGMLQGGQDTLSNTDWAGNAQSLQGSMDGLTRELMPALRNLRDTVSEGLDRAAAQGRQR